MQPPNHNSDKALWLIIFILALFFAGNFIFTQYEISQLKSSLVSTTPSVANSTTSPANLVTPVPAPSGTPNIEITPSPKVIVVTSSPKPGVPQITYIPVSGGNTQNTDWTNIASSQFTMNISDYGSKAYAIWDANLHVDNANGQTFARLF